jgi:hypothetical protein
LCHLFYIAISIYSIPCRTVGRLWKMNWKWFGKKRSFTHENHEKSARITVPLLRLGPSISLVQVTATPASLVRNQFRCLRNVLYVLTLSKQECLLSYNQLQTSKTKIIACYDTKYKMSSLVLLRRASVHGVWTSQQSKCYLFIYLFVTHLKSLSVTLTVRCRMVGRRQNKTEKMWKEMIVGLFKVLAMHFLEGIEKPSKPVIIVMFPKRLELCPCWIQIRNITAWTKLLGHSVVEQNNFTCL